MQDIFIAVFLKQLKTCVDNGWMEHLQYTLQTVQWPLDDLFPSVTVPSHRIRRRCLVWAAFGVGVPADVRYQNGSNF